MVAFRNEGLSGRQVLAGFLLFFFISCARAELYVVVNAKQTVSELSIAQIAQCFTGASTQFTPIEQAETSPIRAEFYKKVLDKEPAQVRSAWARIVFAGQGKLPMEAKSSAAVKKAIAENPNAIGYLEKSALDDSVKVVARIP